MAWPRRKRRQRVRSLPSSRYPTRSTSSHVRCRGGQRARLCLGKFRIRLCLRRLHRGSIRVGELVRLKLHNVVRSGRRRDILCDACSVARIEKIFFTVDIEKRDGFARWLILLHRAETFHGIFYTLHGRNAFQLRLLRRPVFACFVGLVAGVLNLLTICDCHREHERCDAKKKCRETCALHHSIIPACTEKRPPIGRPLVEGRSRGSVFCRRCRASNPPPSPYPHHHHPLVLSYLRECLQPRLPS